MALNLSAADAVVAAELNLLATWRSVCELVQHVTPDFVGGAVIADGAVPRLRYSVCELA